MIHRIVSIKNVGKFVDCRVPGNVAFGQTTLVYAENAQGKTMLAAVLRSLSTGESSYIQERRTIGGQGDQEVNILLADHSTAQFKDGRWNRKLPNIELFDETFVNENVYVGDRVEPKQRQNLHGFAIGEEAVSLKKEIEELTSNITELTNRINSKTSEIETYIGHTMNADDFYNLESIADLDKQIKAAVARTKEIQEADSIAEKSVLSPLSLPQLSWKEVVDLLAKELKDVSPDAQQRLRDHIARHMQQPEARGEAWIEEGMQYIKDDQCPFCGQDIRELQLLQAYRDYFSEAYTDLKEEIQRKRQAAQEALSLEKIAVLQKAILTNESLQEYWQQRIETEFPQMSFDAIDAVRKDLNQLITERIEQKAAAPLHKIAPGDKLKHAMKSYNIHTRRKIKAYNESVKKVNELITELKDQVKTADISTAKGELQRLKLTKQRYSDEGRQLCKHYRTLQEQKEGLDTKKKEDQIKSNQHTENILPQYEKKINNYLKNFGADFEIVKINENFLGNSPSLSYCISINGEPVDLAQDKDGEPAPCFKNTLSSGDKSTLAFAFFLARLDLDRNIEEKVVVFDDPISSLDDFRINCSNNAIVHISEQAEQAIVLSHDWRFLKPIWQKVRVHDRSRVKTLRLRRENSDSAICEWDIVYETQSEYAKNYCILAEYTKKEQGDLNTVAKLIRLVLEDYLRCKAPLAFTENDLLGTMIAKIRTSKEGDESNRLKPLLPELDEINEYSREFHHAGGSSPAKDTELKTYVKRTLDLIYLV